jgi:hypothetical protein
VVTRVQSEILRESILSSCKEVRKEAVSLVDAFQWPDFLLGPYGSFNGDVYENVLREVKSVSGNATPSYWTTLVKPLFAKY